MKKAIDIIFTAVFSLLTLLLIVFSNTETDTVSKTENRKLANPPTAHIGTEEFKTQLSSWLSDNLGFRDTLLKIRTGIMYKGLRIMTSDQVYRGRDGWYFYTPNNNIQIASGGYPLDEKLLEEIAYTQQTVSDYYKSIGKTYMLVLTPSKASIYPEYISKDYSVGESPIDILYKYLKENTDVFVVNSKEELLKHKEEGQLFWKTDTHFTKFGAYCEYLSIVNALNDAGIMDIIPVETTRTTSSVKGEFSAMMGDINILETEFADSVDFVESGEYIKSSALLDEIDAICHENNVSSRYKTVMWKNDSAKDLPKLLILGDSQFKEERKIPNMLAKDFSEIVSTRLRRAVPQVDEIVDADIVMFTCVERFITDILNEVPPGIPVNIPSLPVMAAKNPVANHNMWVDSCNGEYTTESGKINVNKEDKIITLLGWAVDADNEKCLNAVYLKAGDTVIKCDYGRRRTGVVKKYGIDEYSMSGFSVSFDSAIIYDDSGNMLDSISFILEGSDGSFYYEPVEYKLIEAE